MLLVVLTFAIALAVAYAHLREGLMTGFTMTVNVLIAGVVTFSFWEPIADQLEPLFKDSFLAGTEDAICMVFLFALSLGLLRVATNSLAPKEPEFPATVQRVGGAFFGLISGYLVAGFLVCLLQTLPWAEDFMGFEYRVGPERPAKAALPRPFPPDRVWLSLMQSLSTHAFATDDEPFDKGGTYELRYGRYRRDQKVDKGGATQYQPPAPYGGELDKELHKK